jgi:probable rRNA maturation factor
MSKNFSITNKTRGTLPRVPFAKIKNVVLGEKFELSVALVTPSEAREITKRTKHKDKASNVLSFPLSKTSGEIILCPATARREAKAWGATYEDFLAYLFIHGLFHLKGMDHGATMESAERRALKRFKIAIDL